MMNKLITEEEAYNLYLKSGLEEIMPFKADYGQWSFIDELRTRGIEVLYDEQRTNREVPIS